VTRSSGLHAPILVTAAVIAAAASALTALWLLVVAVTVLPARDPGGVQAWSVFAIALLAFAAMTVVDVRPWTWAVPRGLLVVASLVAVTAGGFILATALGRTTDFEGYLVVIGGVVLAHGVIALLRALRRDRSPLGASR
jgi:hypothetical protein